MVNKVILIGNLGADPQGRYTQSGTMVCTLSLATSRRRKDRDGNYIDETEWHRVIVWDKTAEYCRNYLSKGSKVYVEGRLQTRKWTDQQGVDRYTTEVISTELRGLDGRGRGESEGSGGGADEGEPPIGMGGGLGGGLPGGSTGEDVPF